MSEEKMVVCANCGAEFEASLVRCPYCGIGYAPAEEEEYMSRLEEKRRDLESHKKDGEKAMKKGLGKTATVVVLIVAVIVVLLFGGLWMSDHLERGKAQQQKEEFLQNQGITIDEEEPAK